MKLCLVAAVVEGLVAICDRPSGHEPPEVHYDVELNRAWTSPGFGKPARAALEEGARREAEAAYWQNRKGADEAGLGTGMTG